MTDEIKNKCYAGIRGIYTTFEFGPKTAEQQVKTSYVNGFYFNGTLKTKERNIQCFTWQTWTQEF